MDATAMILSHDTSLSFNPLRTHSPTSPVAPTTPIIMVAFFRKNSPGRFSQKQYLQKPNGRCKEVAKRSKIALPSRNKPFFKNEPKRHLHEMKSTILFWVTIIQVLNALPSHAQGWYDFKNAPWHNFEWMADTLDFKSYPGGLQLDAPSIKGSSGIFIPSEAINDAEWEISLTMEFNPSSNNYIDINLAGTYDNFSNQFYGYYLRIGSSEDNISLHYSTSSGDVRLIAGITDRVDFTGISIQARVTRDDAGLWRVYSAVDSGAFLLEGEISDNQSASSSHFGFRCNYTSTRADKFFIHGARVSGEPFIDKLSPSVTYLTVVNQHTFCATFSEPLNPAQMGNASFEIISSSNQLSQLWVSDTLDSQACGTFQNAFQNGFQQLAIISGFADTLNNIMVDTIINFML